MSEDKVENSAIIAIRHGKIDYTNEGLDLSEAGIEEVRSTAEQLKNEVGKYDRLIVVSSPRARSLGSSFTSSSGCLSS